MVVVSSLSSCNAMSHTDIIRLTSADAATAEDISRLLKQLTSTPIDFTESFLERIIAEGNAIFVLREEGEVVGMLTVGSYSSPTGRKAWIEDVVVDSAHRGKGYGRVLVEHAIGYVRTLSPCTLMLTSNPSRIAANELYRNSGFEQKITNVYKMTL